MPQNGSHPRLPRPGVLGRAVANKLQIMPRGFVDEFTLIRRFRQIARIPPSLRSSVLIGIGDDGAVLKPHPARVLVGTTDVSVEHVHFSLSYMTYRQLGYRAAVANVSDLAAMGATPRYALIVLGLSPQTTGAQIGALYAGITAACHQAGAAIIGGDLSASRDVFVSMTLLGEAKPHEILRRSGARAGDILYVTGTLGDSRAGLEILQNRCKGSRRTGRSAAHHPYLARRHISPTARLAESRTLAMRRLASSAIDVSDGLVGDLRHICEESRTGAILDVRRLPLSRSLIAYARARNQDPIGYALAGGEDYELLFTVPPRLCASVDALIHKARLCASPIGMITAATAGLRVIDADGTMRPLTAKSYVHRFAGVSGDRRKAGRR
jgi:thiamine-monophosphate kinase